MLNKDKAYFGNNALGNVLIELFELASIKFKIGEAEFDNTMVVENQSVDKISRVTSLLNFAKVSPNVLVVTDEKYTLVANTCNVPDLNAKKQFGETVSMVISVIGREELSFINSSPNARVFNAPLTPVSRLRRTTFLESVFINDSLPNPTGVTETVLSKALEYARTHLSSLEWAFKNMALVNEEPMLPNIPHLRADMLRSWLETTIPETVAWDFGYEMTLTRTNSTCSGLNHPMVGAQRVKDSMASQTLPLTDALRSWFEKAHRSAMFNQLSVHDALTHIANCTPGFSLYGIPETQLTTTYCKYLNETGEFGEVEFAEARELLHKRNTATDEDLNLNRFLDKPNPNQYAYSWVLRKDLVNHLVHVANSKDITFEEAMRFIVDSATDSDVKAIIETRVNTLLVARLKTAAAKEFMKRKFPTTEDVNDALLK